MASLSKGVQKYYERLARQRCSKPLPDQDTTSSHPFRFLDLPAEIRLLVYEYLSIQTKHLKVELGERRRYPGSKGIVYLVMRSFPVAILATCRQVHAEASKIVHKQLELLWSPAKVIVPFDNIDALSGWEGHYLFSALSTYKNDEGLKSLKAAVAPEDRDDLLRFIYRGRLVNDRWTCGKGPSGPAKNMPRRSTLCNLQMAITDSYPWDGGMGQDDGHGLLHTLWTYLQTMNFELCALEHDVRLAKSGKYAPVQSSSYRGILDTIEVFRCAYSGHGIQPGVILSSREWNEEWAADEEVQDKILGGRKMEG